MPVFLHFPFGLFFGIDIASVFSCNDRSFFNIGNIILILQ